MPTPGATGYASVESSGNMDSRRHWQGQWHTVFVLLQWHSTLELIALKPVGGFLLSQVAIGGRRFHQQKTGTPAAIIPKPISASAGFPRNTYVRNQP